LLLSILLGQNETNETKRQQQGNETMAQAKTKSNKKRTTRRTAKKNPAFDMYKHITDQVIAHLQEGTIPWEKPWATSGARGFARSVSTGKAYQGINQLLLALQGNASPWWLTFNQAKALGGCVRGGESATKVAFWKRIKIIDEETQEEKTIPLLRHFSVFNAEQCDLPEEAIEKLAKRLDKLAGKKARRTKKQIIEEAQTVCDAYLSREKIKLTHGGDSAFYRPTSDSIGMPKMDSFKSANHYYTTLFHESVHSTGHSSRLDRGNDTRDRSRDKELQEYSREELVAEMGAAFLCGITGVANKSVDKNRDAYIKNWLTKLNDDPKAIVVASGHAGKAADFITGIFQATDADDKFDRAGVTQ